MLTLNRGHGTLGGTSLVCLLRNNGDSWKEGSESIDRIVKGLVPHDLRERLGCLCCRISWKEVKTTRRAWGVLVKDTSALGFFTLAEWALGSIAVGAKQPHGTSIQVLSQC